MFRKRLAIADRDTRCGAFKRSMTEALPIKDTRQRWLNRAVLDIGLASLFSDWSHEIATTVLPT